MSAFRWVVLSSQDWSTPSGWDTGSVPDADTDDAFITTAGSYDVQIGAGESIIVDAVELNAVGATLEVQGTLTLGGTSDTLGLAAGTLLLGAGGVVAAGTIDATGGTLASQGGTLSGVTYQGALVLAGDQQALMLQHGLVLQADTAGNPGSIDLSGASNSGLFLLDSETLDDATLNFGTSVANALGTGLGADSGQTLTLGSLFTIDVSGGNSFLGYQTGTYAVNDAGDSLDNAGLIEVSGGTLEIDYGSFSNTGSISVDGGTLTVQSGTGLTNTGSITISNAGVLDLLETLSTAQLAGIAATGGTLEIGGPLNNSGQTLSVGPGSALGAVLLSGTISGGVIQDAGSGMLFGGGTLDAVTYQGTLDLTPQGARH